jgi:4-hydroxy-tetrahydrodipicolinate synthase
VVSIASHLVGREISDMIEAYIAGNTREAARIHALLFPVFRVLFITSNPIPLKEAMRMLGRDSGVLRGPLCPPSEGQCLEIARVLKDFGLQ